MGGGSWRVAWRSSALWPMAVGLLLVGVTLVAAEKTVSGIGPRPPEATATFPIGELVRGREACQTFRAPYPALAEIRVQGGSGGRRLQGPLVFRLWAEGTERPVRMVTMEVAVIGEAAALPFRFPPIAGSAGRLWRFCLEAPEAGAGQGVLLWGAEVGVEAGEISLRGFEGEAVHRARALSFEARYALSPLERLLLLDQRLARGKPGPWGSPGTYGVLFGGSVGLTMGLLWWVVRLDSQGGLG